MKKPTKSISVLRKREDTMVLFICHRLDCMRKFGARHDNIVGYDGVVASFAEGKGIIEGWLDSEDVWNQNLITEQEPDDVPLVLNYG